MQGPQHAEAGDGAESCWPFTEGQPASAFKDEALTLPPAEALPVWTPPPAPTPVQTAHPMLTALMRLLGAPSLVVFGAGMVAATIIIALVQASLGLV